MKLIALVIILFFAIVIAYITRSEYPFDKLQREDIEYATANWYRDEYVLTESELVCLVSTLNGLEIYRETDRDRSTGNNTSLTIHYSDGTKTYIHCDGRFVSIDSTTYRADELMVMNVQQLIADCVEKLFENEIETYS